MTPDVPYTDDYIEKTAVFMSYVDSKTVKRKLALESYVDHTKKQIFEYCFDEDSHFIIQGNFEKLMIQINKSEKILQLQDNWDDQGSPAISKAAWASTIKFLFDYAKSVLKETGRTIITPKIYPSANGSIDIAWDAPTYEILVNIDNKGKVATFYADDKNDHMLQGSFNPNEISSNLFPRAI